MYIESFILTVDPPEVRGGCISVGDVHEGVFTLNRFPDSIESGALLEFALDEDDGPGTYEVQLLLEYSRLENEPQAPVGDPFAIDAIEPSEDWWGPRLLVPQRLALRLRFWGEFEGYLVVSVNGQELAEKALRVYYNDIPEHLGPDEPI